MDATYFNEDGKKIAEIKNGNGYQATFDNNLLCSLVQFQKGLPKGKVEVFNALGIKTGTYSQLDGKKHGEELLYYIDEDGSKAPKNKISLHWDQDVLMGEVKTWYENQTLESQREFNQNKLHGTSLAWYKNGDLMLMEEYEHNKVMKGSYFKKGDKKPVSKIDNGKGTATIYSPEGVLIRKITYEKGAPILDDASS
jgi:antitoxin component YwqK of YwqJK toxin-antitoxin module